MRINITIEDSRDFRLGIINRTKTELCQTESGKLWYKQNSSFTGSLDLVRWIMDNNDFNQLCRFHTNGGEMRSNECFYLEVIRWLKMQKLENHHYMEYLLIPVFEEEKVVEFIGLFAKCQLQHNRKRLTCYRFGNATIEPVTNDTKEAVLCSVSVRTSEFMQKHQRLCSNGVRPEKLVKMPERSMRVLTNYKKFDTMKVPKGTLTN